MKPISIEQASNVLSAWTALEILSPQSFVSREDLAVAKKGENLVGNKKEKVVSFQNNIAPWEQGRKAPDRQKLFYQIIVGTIDLKEAVNLLTKKYATEEKEYRETTTVASEAIIAIIIVNERGHLIKNEQSVVLSSFAWGLPRALNEDLKKLTGWPEVEKDIKKEFLKILQRKDKNGQDMPLDAGVIDEAYRYLTQAFGLPSEIIKDEKFAVISYTSISKDAQPQPLMLNSFFLEDLFAAKILLKEKNPPETLLQYLGVIKPTQRHDILNDHSVLENIVSPQNIPAAKWPGPGRHPLVLLQQAAVNIAMNKLGENDILGINGPPGTGKTTLLRDIIAGLVSKRAEVLSKFEDPEHAFTHVNEADKMLVGKDELKLHKLDPSLHGFEILIASSNNKAVENISAELPSIRAIDKETIDLSYFKTISNELLKNKGEETWGLIAAVLGNADNRYAFCEKFWSDNDYGLLAYLLEVTGSPQKVIVKDLETNEIIGSRKPYIVTENELPANHAEAIKKWSIARKNFKETLNKVRQKLADLEEIRKSIQGLENLEAGLAVEETLEARIIKKRKEKPHFIFRILRSPSALSWKKEYDKLLNWKMFQEQIANLPEELKSHIVDSSLFAKKHEIRHQVVPWCDQQIQRLRDEVFIAAIKLHKAFIDAAAKPLRHNLGAFIQLLRNSGQYATTAKKKNFITDLWSTFFLVVPIVSTTFASVRRMLQDLPPNAFGWLLIDEAGQATPQSAVGAIIRSKRAIITGDPLQIEPVVILPSNLTKAICKEFEIDADYFSAPEASVQTLADQASSYFAEFSGQYGGSRHVGVPLLVHRRCSDPMFSISNMVAYQNLMIQTKVSKPSAIRDFFGQAQWIDVVGASVDKWCPEEGKKVLELLWILKSTAVAPDLYIVTPFTKVAAELRKIVEETKILNGWINKEVARSWSYHHIGTVHTLQGREAEAIILVLGAQDPIQDKGARVWAGKSPNLLNVAVTRAKEVMYVVGNRNLWKDYGVFKELHDYIK